MPLYLITIDYEFVEYDTYSGFVVRADDKDTALR
jgi:hypothetical protein